MPATHNKICPHPYMIDSFDEMRQGNITEKNSLGTGRMKTRTGIEVAKDKEKNHM